MTNAIHALPDPGAFSSIGWLLVCGAALVFAAERTLSFMDRFKEKPPPSDTYTTLVECRALHVGQDARIARVECEVGAIRDEMREGMAELNRQGEDRSVKIHERINLVLENVSELRGELKRLK